MSFGLDTVLGGGAVSMKEGHSSEEACAYLTGQLNYFSDEQKERVMIYLH